MNEISQKYYKILKGAAENFPRGQRKKRPKIALFASSGGQRKKRPKNSKKKAENGTF